MTTLKKVLVAEDDSFLSKVYSTKLTREGFEVLLATDGNEALAKIKTENPDIILLDLIMPIKSGFEVLEEMKKEQIINNVPIIVLTNLGQENDSKKALDLGATRYIVKSDSGINEIVNLVKELL